MNVSKTTISGTIAGAATALQAVPDLSPWVRAGAMIIAGAALGALGLHSRDCPPNCPGTDALGRPWPVSPKSRVSSPKSQVPRDPGPGTQDSGPESAEPSSSRVTRHPSLPVLVGPVLLALGLAGCTYVHVASHGSTDAGSSASAPSASLTGISVFDSGQAIAKAHAAYGYATNGTWAPGISMSGMSQQSSSTGLVTIIQNFRGLIPAPGGTKQRTRRRHWKVEGMQSKLARCAR